jgi:hypothetical protein
MQLCAPGSAGRDARAGGHASVGARPKLAPAIPCPSHLPPTPLACPSHPRAHAPTRPHTRPPTHPRRMDQRGVDGVEMVQLVNLMPSNAEEAYALVPSLKVRRRAARPRPFGLGCLASPGLRRPRGSGAQERRRALRWEPRAAPAPVGCALFDPATPPPPASFPAPLPAPAPTPYITPAQGGARPRGPGRAAGGAAQLYDVPLRTRPRPRTTGGGPASWDEFIGCVAVHARGACSGGAPMQLQDVPAAGNGAEAGPAAAAACASRRPGQDQWCCGLQQPARTWDPLPQLPMPSITHLRPVRLPLYELLATT